MSEQRVAVVGLGKMGTPIAERILEAGFPLAVFNRTRSRTAPLAERGATVLMEKQPISETSWWAVLKDPDGNSVGLYEGTTAT